MAKNKKVISVPFENILIDEEFNSRKSYTKLDDLKDSILKNGLLQPMGVVQSNSDKEDNKYYLVYGFRRYYAIKKAREELGGDAFATVDVVLNKGTIEDLKDHNIAENIERESLSPSEIAEQIKRMVNAGLDQRDIGKRLGRPQSWVSYYYKIATKLGATASKALEEGNISLEQAVDIADIPEKEQKDIVDTVSAAATRDEARKAVKKALKDTNKKTGKKVASSKPSQKDLFQYVRDASFEALSDTTDDSEKNFWNGVAAAIQVTTGFTKFDDLDPEESYVDTDFGTKKEDKKTNKTSKNKKKPVL